MSEIKKGLKKKRRSKNNPWSAGDKDIFNEDIKKNNTVKKETKKETKELINKIKENDQDFEFYPTTEKMIKLIYNDIMIDQKSYSSINTFSILDIGAGNGNFFNNFDKFIPEPKDQYEKKFSYKKYAMEKSEILISAMDKDIIIIGTDFQKQTLIDKKIDKIFCNPPYSQFSEWAMKILKEANTKIIYMILPERWKENKLIMSILEKRNFDYKIIGNDTFIDSDLRAARANVDIIKFSAKKTKYKNDYYETDINDPFDIFFNEHFKINADKSKEKSYETEQGKKENIKNELVNSDNIIKTLETLYNRDMEKLLHNYKSLENLDYEIFKELNIDINNIKSGLQLKIEGLKSLYWKELFSNLDKITNRLTKKSRDKMLSKLNENLFVDFTAENAYSIVIWTLKNSNQYIDDQLKEVYFDMADKENIRNYKSNTKLTEDGWRYMKKESTHFQLDYRLVFQRYNCFNSSGYGEYDYQNGLNKNVHDFINDISTIANNLNFINIDSSYNFEWAPGVENTFYYHDGKKEFMKIRAYKNGNIHCKINQDFMKAFNIEMARLNKWIKNETELSEELDIDINTVKKFYNSNKKFNNFNVKLLT